MVFLPRLFARMIFFPAAGGASGLSRHGGNVLLDFRLFGIVGFDKGLLGGFHDINHKARRLAGLRLYQKRLFNQNGIHAYR